MKTWLLLGFGLIANSALAETRSHLSIDAHEVATSAVNYDNWSTSWGSYDRTTVGRKSVEISVRNFSNAPATVNLSIYFVSHGVEAGRANRDFRFNGFGEIKSTILSPPTEARTLNLEAIRHREITGTLPITNWFVIGWIDGKIFALKGSDPATQTELEQKVRAGLIR